MKEGFWMMDFHVLETKVQVMMDFIGRRIRTKARISGGGKSHIAKLRLIMIWRN